MFRVGVVFRVRNEIREGVVGLGGEGSRQFQNYSVNSPPSTKDYCRGSQGTHPHRCDTACRGPPLVLPAAAPAARQPRRRPPTPRPRPRRPAAAGYPATDRAAADAPLSPGPDVPRSAGSARRRDGRRSLCLCLVVPVMFTTRLFEGRPVFSQV